MTRQTKYPLMLCDPCAGSCSCVTAGEAQIGHRCCRKCSAKCVLGSRVDSCASLYHRLFSQHQSDYISISPNALRTKYLCFYYGRRTTKYYRRTELCRLERLKLLWNIWRKGNFSFESQKEGKWYDLIALSSESQMLLVETQLFLGKVKMCLLFRMIKYLVRSCWMGCLMVLDSNGHPVAFLQDYSSQHGGCWGMLETTGWRPLVIDPFMRASHFPGGFRFLSFISKFGMES